MMAIILAGGMGSRLWPMSTKVSPKQLNPILSEQAMIADVYARLRQTFNREDIYIATVADFVTPIKTILPDFLPANFFVEPSRKDSGPAMAYASLLLTQAGRGKEAMVFVPTDHYIGDDALFLKSLRVGGDLVAQTGKLVDIGIAPQAASTALGYTKIGPLYKTIDGVQVYEFAGHTEKPDKKTANQYLREGHYLWHANYYMYTPEKLLAAYQSHCPEIYAHLQKIQAEPARTAEIYALMPQISIDYAVMEKMPLEQVLIIRGDFGWSDIGAWDVLHDRLALQQDAQGNLSKGLVKHFDSHNCLFYTDNDKLIAAFGLQDLVVVQTKNALLICPKSRAPEVKDLVKRLQAEGLEKYV